MVSPDLTQREPIYFDHLTLAESPKDLDFLIEHMQAKALNFKKYEFEKQLNQER